MSFTDVFATPDELRTVYREPSPGAVRKQISSIDANCRAYIEHSPFVVIATADAVGNCDASPKGGPPGFVKVLDESRLAIPDLSGNNRLDSITNIVESPGIALLFMIPGLDETLRVNGRAFATREESVLDTCTLGELRPRVAIGVEVADAYIHCAKALKRGAVWRVDEWPDRSDMPTIACMLREHSKALGRSEQEIQAGLDESYRTTLWKPGGES